jgi:hypothetical protein
MRWNIATLLSLAACALTPALFAAEEAVPIAGTLTVAGKTYKLAHVVAYELKSDDETRIDPPKTRRPPNPARP